MHNRMTSRRNPNRKPGRTTPSQGETTTPHEVPRLPHERDLSADSQAGGEASGKKMGAQAHEDLKRGMTDTDKGPVMDRTYQKVKSGPAR